MRQIIEQLCATDVMDGGATSLRESGRFRNQTRAFRRWITFDRARGVERIEALRQRLKCHPVGAALLFAGGRSDIHQLRIFEADFF